MPEQSSSIKLLRSKVKQEVEFDEYEIFWNLSPTDKESFLQNPEAFVKKFLEENGHVVNGVIIPDRQSLVAAVAKPHMRTVWAHMDSPHHGAPGGPEYLNFDRFLNLTFCEKRSASSRAFFTFAQRTLYETRRTL